VDNITPEQVFTGNKSSLSHLRIFGTQALVHVPKHLREKMALKSQTCILLGFDELTKGYRYFCPQTQRIIISRDITIDEKMMYSSPTSSASAAPSPTSAA